jgi:hypothetical protein
MSAYREQLIESAAQPADKMSALPALAKDASVVLSNLNRLDKTPDE